MFFFTLIL